MNPITESSMVNETLVDHRSGELNGSPIDQFKLSLNMLEPKSRPSWDGWW